MKKLFAILLAVCMVFSLVACGSAPAGNSQTESKDTAPSVPAAAPAQTETKTEAPAAEAPVDTTPYKIGLITPVTGGSALEGEQVQRGAKMAVEEINAAGGVCGHPIELYIEDGQNDNTASVNAAQKLLDKDKVDIIVGAWGSSPTLAIMPLLEEYEIPLICETATNVAITESGNKWVFRIASNEARNSAFIATRAVTDLDFGTVGFIAQNNDWGRGAVEQYMPLMEAAGATCLPPEYLDTTVVNFATSIAKLKNAGADSLVITQSLQNTVLILEQLREANWYPKLLGTSGYNINSLMKVAGDPELLEGLNFLGYTIIMGLQDTDPEIKAIVEDFISRYEASHNGDTVERSNALGYDAVYTAAHGLENAGGQLGDSEALRQGIAACDFMGVSGHISFDEKGQADIRLYLTKIEDGVQKLVLAND